MTRYADQLKVLVVALLALQLAACASGGSSRSSRDSSFSLQTPATAAKPSASADKGNADQRFKDALKLLKDKQNAPAQAAFLSLSQDFPEFSGPLTNLSILYAQNKQRDAAVASLNKAVAANANNAIAYNWLGILYREGNDFSRAEQSYRKALSLRPDYAAVHFNLAILYDVSLKRPADALAEYRAYQKMSGDADLVVSAWIKELETPAASAATVGAQP